MATIQLYLGTAGWQLPAPVRDRTPDKDSVLERYATLFNAVEVNSTFYKLPRPATAARWAASVPAGFRFAVKMPKAITHQRGTGDIAALLADFRVVLDAFGPKRGPVLVQLPPKQAFDVVAEDLLWSIADHDLGPVVVEPRHRSWSEADGLLRRLGFARVAADPSRFPGDQRPGGDQGLAYLRLHGSPRTYWSAYTTAQIDAWARTLADHPAPVKWVVFDNTAQGAAAQNALELEQLWSAGKFGS